MHTLTQALEPEQEDRKKDTTVQLYVIVAYCIVLLVKHRCPLGC